MQSSKYLLIYLILFSFIILFDNSSLYGFADLTDPPFIYKARGDRYRRIGLLNKALYEYEKALSIKKDYPDCHYWSAVILLKKKLYTQALYEIKSALHFKKEKFENQILYIDTLFLEMDVYYSRGTERDAANIETGLDNIKEKIHESKSEALKEHYQYQLGKAHFYTGKLFYRRLVNNDWEDAPDKKKDVSIIADSFELSIRYNYKPAISYYYLHLYYGYILSLKDKGDPQIVSNRVKRKVNFDRAKKLNPNIILDFRRQEKKSHVTFYNKQSTSKEMDKIRGIIQKILDDTGLNAPKVEVVDNGVSISLNEKLLFDFNRSNLKSEAIGHLDKLAKALGQLNEALKDHVFTIIVEGHTDDKGSPKSNFLFSEKRAITVRRYLIKKGVSKKIEYKGYGFTKSIASNDTEEGRRQNRRVEIFIRIDK